MAQTHYKTLLRKALLGFISEPDPVLAMLQWIAQQMMLIEAEAKVGAEKGKHAKDRKTHFSGARVRRMDTRLGTLYLYIPKLRKGGYIPFFVTERKRSELALIALIQEAFKKIVPEIHFPIFKAQRTSKWDGRHQLCSTVC
jgi:putative transposase